MHEARKLRATALVYVSGIATSAPSTAYAVPLPRVARGRLGLWHLSFPRQSGGSGERSEPIGAFVQQPLLCAEKILSHVYENNTYKHKYIFTK